MANYLIQPQTDHTADPTNLANAVFAFGVADPGTITGLTNGTAYVAREFVLSPASAAFTPAVPATVPAAFVDADWSVATGASTGGRLDVTIASLPSNGGATITDIEYELDANGIWESSGGTSDFNITGLTAATSYDVRLRAVNSVGSGTAGNTETATSSAAAAGPTAVYTDDFSDPATLSNYTDPPGDWEVVGGVARQVDLAGLNINSWVTFPTVNDDHYIKGTVGTWDGPPRIYLLRDTSVSDFGIYLNITIGGVATIKDGFNNSSLATGSVGDRTGSTDDVMELRITTSGTRATALFNGVEISGLVDIDVSGYTFHKGGSFGVTDATTFSAIEVGNL